MAKSINVSGRMSVERFNGEFQKAFGVRCNVKISKWVNADGKATLASIRPKDFKGPSKVDLSIVGNMTVGTLKKRFEEYKTEGYDRDAYTLAEQIGTRTGINPLSGKKVNQRSNRRCSYCKYKFGNHCPEGRGHTRRTCEVLKKDKKDIERQNVEYRKTVLDNLKDLGIGVGALSALVHLPIQETRPRVAPA